MFSRKNWLLFFVFLNGFIFSNLIYGQVGGIKGTIYDENGDPLPFASIFVKESDQGAATNPDGYYELHLPSGRYLVYYQYLGYKTQSRTMDIEKEIVQVDIQFQVRDFVLSNLTFRAGEEDPAYSIMRKAIAKSNII